MLRARRHNREENGWPALSRASSRSCIWIAFMNPRSMSATLPFAFTCVLAIPSAVYRAKREGALLRERFGDEWTQYADAVGFMFPTLATSTNGSESTTSINVHIQ